MIIDNNNDDIGWLGTSSSHHHITPSGCLSSPAMTIGCWSRAWWRAGAGRRRRRSAGRASCLAPQGAVGKNWHLHEEADKENKKIDGSPNDLACSISWIGWIEFGSRSTPLNNSNWRTRWLIWWWGSGSSLKDWIRLGSLGKSLPPPLCDKTSIYIFVRWKWPRA